MAARCSRSKVRAIIERDSLNATRTRYLEHSQVIDEVLAFEQGGAAYYPLSDALPSIYAVADSSGATVRSYTYDVYGERRTSTASGPELAFAEWRTVCARVSPRTRRPSARDKDAW